MGHDHRCGLRIFGLRILALSGAHCFVQLLLQLNRALIAEPEPCRSSVLG
jgi:hypothetical protein